MMPLGRVYDWVPDGSPVPGGCVVLREVRLARLDAGRRLCGRYVDVSNRGWISECDGALGGYSMAPLGSARPDLNGDYLFQPERGGEFTDPGIRLDEAARRRHREASRFGEVNTYYHLDLMAAYIDGLLRDLGAQPLPRVTAIVNAHGAEPTPEGLRDGAYLGDRCVPFQGGHYRVSDWCRDIRERLPVSSDGEIHLGPGRNLLTHGALAHSSGGRYLANASHNAGTLYHEYGHHINRHTADFRANAFRPHDRHSNRKVATDEGMCDYWAAAMLKSPHIWAWHRRHDERQVHRRSLVSPKTMADYDARQGADPHVNGTIWAAAMWALRTRMGAAEPTGARQADRLALQMLMLIGLTTGPEKPPTAASVCRAREGFGVAIKALLDADRIVSRGRWRRAIVDIFCARGIAPHEGHHG